MQIELPDELIARAQQIAGRDQDPAVVFGEALAVLEFERGEVAATEAGIAAYEAGDFESLEAFDRAFRHRHNIPQKS